MGLEIGSCQHDPMQHHCSLIIESSWMGTRVRCKVCEQVALIQGKSGRFTPPPRPTLETSSHPLPDETRAATSRGAHSTEDAGRPEPSRDIATFASTQKAASVFTECKRHRWVGAPNEACPYCSGAKQKNEVYGCTAPETGGDDAAR
jgi:hypothetical protein